MLPCCIVAVAHRNRRQQNGSFVVILLGNFPFLTSFFDMPGNNGFINIKCSWYVRLGNSLIKHWNHLLACRFLKCAMFPSKISLLILSQSAVNGSNFITVQTTSFFKMNFKLCSLKITLLNVNLKINSFTPFNNYQVKGCSQ